MVPGATTLDDGPVILERARRRFTVEPPEPSFTAPMVREDSVRRTELLSRLERERTRPLVLLSAPAGYGKTTLLAQWTEASEVPFAWVMLGQATGDGEALVDSI